MSHKLDYTKKQMTQSLDVSLDDPSRGETLVGLVSRKPALRRFYDRVYRLYSRAVAESPRDGIVIELGSGASFAKTYIPGLITSDVVAYPHVDRVLDATKMDLPDKSVRALLMMNVLHHIPDAHAFFRESSRVLKPNGHILIFDQYLSPHSRWILKNGHHEGFDDQVPPGEWKFQSSGPLSSANGALGWLVFFRDRGLFEKTYPSLEIVEIKTHAPFYYWLSGGLKRWSLIPALLAPLLDWLDSSLVRFFPGMGSFFSVKMRKR